MTELEEALKERIKELTCLYEITSYISNNSNDFEKTIELIAFSLKKALKNNHHSEIVIKINKVVIKTNDYSETLKETYKAPISLFNKKKGFISIFTKDGNILKEEKDLIRDITLKITAFLEKIETQKRENEINRKMEQADRLVILGEITAGIAHELNTPLTNILGFAELLLEQFKDNEKALEDVDKIIKNTIFSREIVKKLMFFSCEMPQEIRQINIIPIIKNAVDFLSPIFKKERVKYLIQLEKSEIYFNTDPIQLTQVIFNLLTNAIYFSPKEGLVTIEAYDNSKNVVLKISDEGKGVSKEIQKKIFQPFFTTKPIGEGSGLGLSVVHGIVSSHKGTITIENNSKKGTTFVITLPKKIK